MNAAARSRWPLLLTSSLAGVANLIYLTYPSSLHGVFWVIFLSPRALITFDYVLLIILVLIADDIEARIPAWFDYAHTNIFRAFI